MMKKTGFVLAALALVGASFAQTLKVGSQAPAFKPAKWIKGAPVTLKKGSLYVVEFWATWCPPCRESIPHLTSLAKKYKGKATVIGVSVSEAPPQKWGAGTVSTVAKFVKEQGAKMNYTIAMDGKNADIAKAWMTKANVNYIPWACIVGKDGKIAWMGSPFEIDAPLAKFAK